VVKSYKIEKEFIIKRSKNRKSYGRRKQLSLGTKCAGKILGQ
jgi:hypothetical protein